MGRNRTKTSNTRSARDTVDQLSKPSPRMKLRGSLNENVTFISGNEYNEPASVPASSTAGAGRVLLAPGNNAGRANAAVNQVGRFFQNGLFLPGTFVKYIPSVGLNTPGNIIMGFIDSPDLMRVWNALTPGAELNFIRDLNNSKTGPVWQELTFPLTQAPRRKTFMIDSSIELNIDSLDQSVQGMVVWSVYGVESESSSKAYGQLLIHCKAKFQEVKSFVAPA